MNAPIHIKKIERRGMYNITYKYMYIIIAFQDTWNFK